MTHFCVSSRLVGKQTKLKVCVCVCFKFIGVMLTWMCVSGVRSPGTGVTECCELSCGCRELNSGPPEE